MTHLSAAYLVKRAVSPRRNMLAFLLGATLPDLISYIPQSIIAITLSLERAGVLRSDQIPIWFSDLPRLFYPFHGIFPFIILCWILALLFPIASRQGILLNLILGGCLHFSLDLMQIRYGTVGYLLFPLSNRSYSLDWIGTESSLYVVPFLAGAAAAVFLWDRFMRKE